MVQATGANQLQTIIYAVVPQIIPPYISFTMYRWDINVRMATIVGFVGGGGIGLLLLQQRLFGDLLRPFPVRRFSESAIPGLQLLHLQQWVWGRHL